MRAQKIDGLPDGFSRLGGWKLDRLDVGRTASNGADELGPSGFDSSKKRHRSSVAGKLGRVWKAAPGSVTGYNKVSMKFSVFARLIAFSGLAAGAVVVAVAQQPAAPATPAAAPAASNLAPDAVVLTIGERKVTRAQFELLLASLAQNGRPAMSPAEKRKVAEQYGELESMALEARKRMLDQSPETKEMLAVQTDNVLANQLAKKITEEAKFTDLDLRAYYDAHKDEFEEAKGSHILIRFKGSKVPLKPSQTDLTEPEALAKAQDIRAKIVAGADFAALAKTDSDDTGSAVKGGDLGSFKHKQMVPPFDQAAFSLPIGEVSEPVRSDFGYHLIKISARTTKTFEEAKPEIEKQMKPKIVKAEMDKIKAQTPVTLNDEYFVK
jgi:peptidyl-prolyl cis-trans isomerase C